MPQLAKHFFVSQQELVYLADFCFLFPCHTYLHLLYGIRSRIIKTYKIVSHDNADQSKPVVLHSLPAKYIPHEDICRDFSTLVFLKKHTDKLHKYTEKFSRLDDHDLKNFDFCTQINIQALAPQLAYVMQAYSRCDLKTDFEANEIRSDFYSHSNTLYSYFKGERSEWRLPYASLWPEELPLAKGKFDRHFVIENAEKLFQVLKLSGIVKFQRVAQIVDGFFPIETGLSQATKAKLYSAFNDSTVAVVTHGAQRKRWQRACKKNKMK